MKKQKNKFFTSEEIKKMVLEGKKLPKFTNSSCNDFIVKARTPYGVYPERAHKKLI